jgi:hypothetical protein
VSIDRSFRKEETKGLLDGMVVIHYNCLLLFLNTLGGFDMMIAMALATPAAACFFFFSVLYAFSFPPDPDNLGTPNYLRS